MRILHVIPGIAPRYGGPSTAIMPMCAALNRLPGMQVEIAATDADGAGRSIDLKDLTGWPVPVHLFRRDFSEQWKFSRGLGGWLWRHARDYDLMHVHALWSFSTAAACAAARRHDVPVVVRPCGMLSPYTWERGAWKKRLYWLAVERRNLTHARWIHVTSPAEAREVEALRLPARVHPVVIPQGIDEGAWQTEVRPDYLRKRCGGRAGDRPIVLFLSRLHPKKGIVDYLLPAFARLRTDAFLAIAGGADEHEPGYEAQVRAAVDRLGLSGRVALLGPVTAAERWWLFDGAALFVLPSHSENFGIVVTEAMARGLPVVVSNTVQACDHVAQAGAGRVVPLQVGAVTAAVEELLGNVQDRSAMGQRGGQYVREQLSWGQVTRSIASHYQGMGGKTPLTTTRVSSCLATPSPHKTQGRP
jgi:glycosyltransferase involved in cell wall biosynthesis